jgi:hypothetical protein
MAKSAVALGASIAASVWSKLGGKVKAKGGTEDAIHILDTQEGDALLDAVADLLVRAELKTRNRFAVTVDYGTPLDQMIAAGNYGYVNPNITSQNFPITGTGVVETEIILAHFDRDIESDDAVRKLREMRLEPAGIEHATAFGTKYPDVQREYPIVFLRSVWSFAGGGRGVPCLDDWRAERVLVLGGWGGGWRGVYRFAAVRRSPVL